MILIKQFIYSDSILAALIDGSRGSGNYQLYVKSKRMDKSLRVLPLNYLLDEESETILIKHIINCPRKYDIILYYSSVFLAGLTRNAMMQRFNANIPYNGLNYSSTSEV